MASPIRIVLTTMAVYLAALALASGAHAQRRVVLLHDGERAPILAEGLKIELAATGAEVLVAPSPAGDTSLLRAGAAQRLAREANAAFAIWVERQPTSEAGDLVRVVDPESDHVRDAPLPAPIAALDARTFAAVTASLIGEHLDPVMTPSSPIRVRVHVETPTGDIEIDAVADGSGYEAATGLADPAEGTPAPPIGAPIPSPPPARPGAEPATAPDVMARDGAVLNVGLVTAFVATGAELGVGFHLNRFLRLELFGQGVVHYIEDPAPAGTVGLGLTRVGASESARFDAGGFAALLITGGRNGGTAVTTGGGGTVATQIDPYFGFVTGAHIGWMWELSSAFALGLRLSGGLSMVHDDDEWHPTPFGMLSLRTDIRP